MVLKMLMKIYLRLQMNSSNNIVLNNNTWIYSDNDKWAKQLSKQ